MNNSDSVDIDWEEPRLGQMSESAKDLLKRMLTVDSEKRINVQEIKKHPFFKDVDWSRLRDTRAPFIPSPESQHDTSYFDGKFRISCVY